MRLILCQYQTVAPNIQGLYRVFTLIHTLVKPPFWWMPLERRDIKRLNVAHAGFGTEFSQKNYKNLTHHYLDVLYFSNSNVHCVIHWQAQVNQKVFVGHRSQFHEWYGVAVIKTTFIFIRLQKHGPLEATKTNWIIISLHVLNVGLP